LTKTADYTHNPAPPDCLCKGDVTPAKRVKSAVRALYEGAADLLGTTGFRMNQVAKTQFRWVVGIALLILSTFFWFSAFRFISFPFLVATWILLLTFKARLSLPVLSVWAVWLALSFSPVDIYPLPKGGPPRLVPLVMGLPTPETVERAKRGEVILGGCIVTGFEPKYYLVR